MFRRSSSPSVDTLTTTSSLEAFAARQDAVTYTAHELGLTGHAILIGTAGMAALRLDGNMDASAFDLDAFVDEQTFTHLQSMEGARSRPDSDPDQVDVPETMRTLSATGLRAHPISPSLANVFKADTFEDLAAEATEINGVLVPSPSRLAHAKIVRGRTNDYAGIIKAHYTAWHTGHPTAMDDDWMIEVIKARNCLSMRTESSRFEKRSLPQWLGQLAASGFDDPAFTSIPLELDIVRQRQAY